MSQEMHQNKSILILPHWHMGGGAGFYICDLIKLLTPYFRVRVAGRYAVNYDARPISSVFLDNLCALSVPAYEGVRPIATLCHIILSLWRILQLLFMPKAKRFDDIPSAFFFTSSIQAISIPITRRFFPSSKIVIVVQEQVNLSRPLGSLVLWFLKQSDLVLSITEDWAVHARKFGIDPLVVRNHYNPAYAEPENNQTPAIESDLLYVGGGAKIKGFDDFVVALPHLLEKSGLRILCLGRYNESEIRILDKIGKGANSGACLGIVGQVPDIRPYLRGTKLLILPIGSPHFCRPAVEAGFFSKTFIIPDYDGLDDFSINDKNCKKYRAGDNKQLVEIAITMLKSPQLLSALGQGNLQVASQFKIPDEVVRIRLKTMLEKDDV